MGHTIFLRHYEHVLQRTNEGGFIMREDANQEEWLLKPRGPSSITPPASWPTSWQRGLFSSRMLEK
jgi:hypothetical protein